MNLAFDRTWLQFLISHLLFCNQRVDDKTDKPKINYSTPTHTPHTHSKLRWTFNLQDDPSQVTSGLLKIFLHNAKRKWLDQWKCFIENATPFLCSDELGKKSVWVERFGKWTIRTQGDCITSKPSNQPTDRQTDQVKTGKMNGREFQVKQISMDRKILNEKKKESWIKFVEKKPILTFKDDEMIISWDKTLI